MTPQLPRARKRGDRRGFEPRDPGALPPPDRPAPAVELDGASYEAWDGSPVDALVIDLPDGLVDAARAAPYLGFARRSGRVGGIACTTDPALAAWLSGATGLPLVDPDGTVAALPAATTLTGTYDAPPRAPLLALSAHVLGIGVEALAGVCVTAGPGAVDEVRTELAGRGWVDEPLVVVHAAPDQPGPWAAECAPDSLIEAFGAMREEHQLFPVDLGEVPLDRWIPLIEIADAVVTGATAAADVAGCIGTPTLAFLGPTDPRLAISAIGTFGMQPPSCFCPKIPCGRGSPERGPLDGSGGRAELPCPPRGGCVTRLGSEVVASAVARFVGRVWHGRSIR